MNLVIPNDHTARLATKATFKQLLLTNKKTFLLLVKKKKYPTKRVEM